MSGVVEELRDQVDDLSRKLTRLCAKAGHEFGATYKDCGQTTFKRHSAAFAAADHALACEICGTYKCED